MKTLWQRFERWLADNGGRDILLKLEEPASDEALDQLAATTGTRLCAEHEQLLRVHNGTWIGACTLYGWQLHPASEIGDGWTILNDGLTSGEYEGKQAEPHGPVRPVWWSPRWLPIAYNLAGSYYCADLDPLPGGQVGQVLIFWHDRPERRVVAPSVRAWVSQFVDDLDAHKYIVGTYGIEPVPGSDIPKVLGQ